MSVQDPKQDDRLFDLVNVADPRVGDISDRLSFGVKRNASNSTTYQVANSSNGSKSVMNFNFNSPGAQAVIDRLILLKATVSLSFTVKNSANNEPGFVYTKNGCLSAFPLHQMFTTANLSINNSSTNFEAQSLLNMIHRVMDEKDLREWASYCPTMPDKYGTYANQEGYANSPWRSFQYQTADNHPNGAHRVVVTANPNPATSNAGVAVKYTLTFTSTEPLLVPPCALSHHSHNGQGFLGVNNLKLSVNMNNALRCLRTNLPPGTGNGQITGLTLESITNANLFLRVLTPSVVQPLPRRNLIPYTELQRMLTSVPNAVANGSGSTVVSNAVNLSQIPDSVLLCIRKKADTATIHDPDSALPITGISINFANRSGILSSASQEQLYIMSRDNGYQGSWPEWSSSGNIGMADHLTDPLLSSGSYLCLKFGRDITMSEPFYAPGSLGNFTFQATVHYSNNTGNAINADTYELAMVFANPGFLATQQGSSVLYSGALSPQMVEHALNKPAITDYEDRQMVGGNFFKDFGRGFVKGFKGTLGVAKHLSPVADLVAPGSGSAIRTVAGIAGAGKDDRFH